MSPSLADLDNRLRRLEVEMAQQRIHLEQLLALNQKVDQLLRNHRANEAAQQMITKRRERLLASAVALITIANGVIAIIGKGALS
jgi:hypothetical protein